MSPIQNSSGHRAVAITEASSAPANANAEVVEAQLFTPPTVSEVLGASIVATEADDSFAIKHSILAHPETRMLEYDDRLYVWTRPIMRIVSLFYMVSIGIYRLLFLAGLIKAPPRETQDEKEMRFVLGPAALTWAFCFHPLGHTVRNGVTTSAALDVIYAVPCLLKEPKTVRERVVRYWLNQPDGQAVRNRLRRTYNAAREELARLIENGECNIRFLVLACGSAQASIEAMAHTLEDHPEVKITLTLVDVSESSLRRALRLAQARGVAHCVVIKVAKLQDFLFFHAEAKDTWHLIEVVGFMDYRSPGSFNRTGVGIRSVLVPGGLLIVAGICHSKWAFEVRWVINWPLLIRRTAEEIDHMLEEAGFWNREALKEPHGIHYTLRCRA